MGFNILKIGERGIRGLLEATGIKKGKNPADPARPILNEVPQIGHNAYDAHASRGNEAWDRLAPMFEQFAENPQQEENDLLKQYEPSQYFQDTFEQLMAQMRNSAGYGGYRGGAGDEARRGELARQLLGKDRQDWLDRQKGVRREGMEGLNQAVGRGFQAQGDLADFLGTNKQNQANLEFSGRQQQDMNQTQRISELMNAVAAYFGGGKKPGGTTDTQSTGQTGQQSNRSVQYKPMSSYGFGSSNGNVGDFFKGGR